MWLGGTLSDRAVENISIATEVLANKTVPALSQTCRWGGEGVWGSQQVQVFILVPRQSTWPWTQNLMSLRHHFLTHKTEKIQTALTPSRGYLKVSVKTKYTYKKHLESYKSYKIKCRYKVLSSPLPYRFLVILLTRTLFKEIHTHTHVYICIYMYINVNTCI